MPAALFKELGLYKQSIKINWRVTVAILEMYSSMTYGDVSEKTKIIQYLITKGNLIFNVLDSCIFTHAHASVCT